VLISASGTVRPAERRTVAIRRPGWTAARGSPTCGAIRSATRSRSSTSSAIPQKRTGCSAPPARSITSAGSWITSRISPPRRKNAWRGAPAGVGSSRTRRRSRPAACSAATLRSSRGEAATRWSIETTPLGCGGAGVGGGRSEILVGSPSSSALVASRSDQPTMPKPDPTKRIRTPPIWQLSSSTSKPSAAQPAGSSATVSSSIVGAGIWLDLRGAPWPEPGSGRAGALELIAVNGTPDERAPDGAPSTNGAGPSPGPGSQLSDRRRTLILAICCMSLLIVAMDNTIVNVALPSIKRDLHASLSGLQWTIDAYVIVIASLLLLSGSTADRLGRRRTFQVGLLVFVAGSLLCSLAPTLGWLIAARALQGVGGSMLNPVAMSIITNVFTEPRERARAIGAWGAVVGISLALGPIVGGALTDSVSWRAIFWINVPIGLAAVILTALYVPESRAPRARRIDPVGQLLVIVALASLTYAIIEAPSAGWGSAQSLGLFALSVLAVAGLVLYEPRRTDPLIELRFFRSAPFSGATLIAISAFAGFSGFLLLNTLYLQDVRGYSALDAGLCTLPMALAALACSPLSARVLGSRGPRLPLFVAGGCMAVSALVLTQLTSTTPLLLLLGVYAVFGIGFGSVNPPITYTAVSGMPNNQAGVAAAVASTSRQVGQALGVAVIGSILGTAAGSQISVHLTGASHPAWWVIAGCGASVLALGAASTGRWARRTARRTTAELEGEAAPQPLQPA
jgi:EmrB/QacA subfamily drug resistance transporter